MGYALLYAKESLVKVPHYLYLYLVELIMMNL